MDSDKNPLEETSSELVLLPLSSKTTLFDHYLVHSILLSYQNNKQLQSHHTDRVRTLQLVLKFIHTGYCSIHHKQAKLTLHCQLRSILRETVPPGSITLLD